MRELLEQDDLPVYLDLNAREMLLKPGRPLATRACCAIRSFKTAPTRSGSPGRVRGSSAPFRRSENSPAGPKCTTRTSPWCSRKRRSPAFKRSTAASLTNCPDAVSLARQFPYRVVEKYERFLSDDLTAELFARERMDLGGALEKIREIGTRSVIHLS